MEKYIPATTKDATIVKINSKVFKDFTLYDWGVSVRIEFDRWADFDKNDFSLLNIELLKLAPKPWETFTTKIVVHSETEVDNHGHTYDIPDDICVKIPFAKFIEYLDKEAEVIVKIL